MLYRCYERRCVVSESVVWLALIVLLSIIVSSVFGDGVDGAPSSCSSAPCTC